jgi:tetratricopeptide (TPR) repeat protein
VYREVVDRLEEFSVILPRLTAARLRRFKHFQHDRPVAFRHSRQHVRLPDAGHAVIRTKPDSGSRQKSISGIPSTRPRESQAAIIRNAGIVVLQVADSVLEVPDYVSSHSKIVRFPYVSGGFLWPFASEGHVNCASSRMIEFGAYGECGDAFLNRMIRDGVGPDEAIDRYLELDIVNRTRLDRRYELSLELQARRDAIAEIDATSFIKSHFPSEHIFLGRGHLGRSLTAFLAIEVFGKMDIPASAVAWLLRPGQEYFFPRGEHPIHPKISAHFALSYGRTGYKFRVNETRQTFDEFCRAYMGGEFNVLIADGIRMLRQQQDVNGAIRSLESGLAVCPDSVSGLLALASAYTKLGDDSKSMVMLEKAASADPTDAEPLIALAERLLSSQDYERIDSLVQTILEHHPNHRHAVHLQEVLRNRGYR